MPQNRRWRLRQSRGCAAAGAVLLGSLRRGWGGVTQLTLLTLFATGTYTARCFREENIVNTQTPGHNRSFISIENRRQLMRVKKMNATPDRFASMTRRQLLLRN